MTRTIRCSITMDLIEGEHFNFENQSLTDFTARSLAEAHFEGMVEKYCEEGEIGEWIESKIIEPIGDN